MNPKFQGVYPVAITPFRADGSFDFDAARENLEYLISAGVPGIVVLGATGEYMSVTIEEHKAYIKELVPDICNRVKVIVGATRESPDDVIELVNNAKDCGAHAAMVLSSPYCHPSQEEIFENYRYIMEKTDFPLVVYNNPGSCGVSIEQKTFQKIYQLPHTAIIKESSGTAQKLSEILSDAPESTSIFCGCDNLALESFAAGANGWISMLANVAPKQCLALFDAVYVKHDLQLGREIYKNIYPALNVLESFAKPVQALKYLINRKTGTGGFCRRPRLELTPEEKTFVVNAMCADQLF